MNSHSDSIYANITFGKVHTNLGLVLATGLIVVWVYFLRCSTSNCDEVLLQYHLMIHGSIIGESLHEMMVCNEGRLSERI